MDKVMEIGFVLIALYVLSYALSAIQDVIMATGTQKVSKTMRSDISRKINKLPMWYCIHESRKQDEGYTVDIQR